MEEAVKNTLSISRTSTEKKKSIYVDGKKNSPKSGQASSLYDYDNPVDAMSSQEKVELLQEIEALARKKDPRISQVMASISGSFSIVMIVTDRGLIKKGMLADINIIDFDNLQLYAPELVNDLPAGGKRLIQNVDGYETTIKSGVITYNQGIATTNLPGKLLRN